jgi:hypothetical protein
MPFKPVDAAIVVSVGPCIDDTDFKTLETAIAWNAAGMSVDLFEETAAGVTKTDVAMTTGGNNDWTHKGNGIYEIEITAAQNNTEGMLWMVGVCDGVLPFESPRYTVVPGVVYDSLVLGTDNLQVDAVEISGDSAAADNLEKDYDGTGYAKANSTIGTCTTLTGHTAQTGDNFARLGAPAGASVSADIADVPTVAELNARTLVAASYFDPAADTVANVTTVGTLTGHTAQTGDSFARIGAPTGASVSADIADIPTVAEFNARTLAAADYFDPAADTVANVTNVGTVTTNTDMRGTDNALLAASAPANFGDLAISITTGKVTVGTNDDKTNYGLADNAITSGKYDELTNIGEI